MLSSAPTDSRPTRGAAQPERDARVGRAHDRELDQVVRPAFDGGAGVEQDRRAGAGGNDGGQRRTIDAGQAAERRMRRHHRRTGVPGAEERLGPAVRHGLGGDANRRPRLAAQRRRRRFLHLDALGGVQDVDVEPGDAGMPGQLPLDQVAATDQEQTDLQVTRGDERSVDDARGGLVAAHRVNGDAQCVRVREQATSCQLASRQPQLGTGELEAGN